MRVIRFAVDLYRFICEEIEDRRAKPEVSRLRLWSRWWTSIGDKINLGIWDGPMETKAEVRKGIREMKKVLEEVEEGERLVAEAGVKIADPRRKVEERQGRRKIREVVKAGALKAKGYVWLNKQGTRSAEHRRELWMHADDVTAEEVKMLNDSGWIPAAEGLTEAHRPLVERVQSKEYQGENPIAKLVKYAAEDAEWTKGIVIYDEAVNESLPEGFKAADVDWSEVEERMRIAMTGAEEKFMECIESTNRDGYTKTAEELEATPEEIVQGASDLNDGLRAWGNVIRVRGEQKSRDLSD